VRGIPPEIGYSPDNQLSLTYFSEQDLTLRQLEEFLTAITKRLKEVFNDLKHPIHIWEIIEDQTKKSLRDYAEAKGETIKAEKKIEIDMSAIRRIIIYGSQERGTRNVLNILDDMITHIKEDSAICFDIGITGCLDVLVSDGKWIKNKEITKFIAKKLDELLNILNKG